MNFRMVSPALLLIGLIAIPSFASADGAATLMPAHPNLIDRVGRQEVARMHQAQYTTEMQQELRLDYSLSKAAALTGTGTPLIVLWDFSDHAADVASHPTSAYDDMLFSTGVYPTGSMNDYYLEASFGQFGVGGQIIGWTTANNTYVSYENPDGSQDAYTARAMIEDMVAQLDASIDFSTYDSDNDGFVDGLFFVHAGAGQEESGNPNDIWSHAWVFGGAGLGTNDGVAIQRYSVEPEEFSNGDQMTMGVFTHEYGHMIGLPDLYDTDYSSAGIGQWGLMSGGSWTARPGDQAGSCPAGMTAWCKTQMGWITPLEYTGDAAGLLLPPANTNPVAFKFFKQGDAGSSEYFLVENRRRIGFDEGLLSRQIAFGLPDPEGMIIYHVDESVSTNSSDGQRLVDVVDASPWLDGGGTWHENLDAPTADYDLVSGYNRGDNGDLWPGFTAFTADTTDWVGPRNRDTFNDHSIPTAGDNECGSTGLELSNISLVSSDVVFDLSFGSTGTGLYGVAANSTWDFELNTDDWKFCNSYAHLDQTQNSGCSGNQGLWFGIDGWDNCSGVGYGNGWNDFAWVTVGVTLTSPEITIKHKYELESGYDYAFIEIRPAGVGINDWTQLVSFDGNSGCVTNNYAIPAGILAQADPDDNGVGFIDVRLRMMSDGGWSSEDGSFCGIGWWVDEISVSEMYVVGVDLPGISLNASLSPAAPNPFNPSTTLAYTIPNGAQMTSLVIYDQRGRQVRTLAVETAAGQHKAVWDGRANNGGQVASGLYFARLQVDGVTKITKMALIK